MNPAKYTYWIIWAVMSLGLSGFLGYELFVQEQKPNFLIGETSIGHHQIELVCTTCHTEPFGGTELLQDACMNCHEEELDIAQDSHPRSKFTDPRNADRLEKIDARYCVSCHVEHNEDITGVMGLTEPEDVCFNCHEDIAEDRDSHTGMAFTTCASAGCHNFHDNRALYEDYLVANAEGPWVRAHGSLPESALSDYLTEAGHAPAATPVPGLPNDLQGGDMAAIEAAWQTSSHAMSNVGCNTCHGSATQWIEAPALETCATCHEPQTSTFMQGKHGMRLAQNLSPMQPALSLANHGTLPFADDSLERELDCNTCHDAHAANTLTAAVDSCLGCHADDHSLAYLDSPHGRLWEEVEAGALSSRQTVSCAGCHMPVSELPQSAHSRRHEMVQHNQNDNLRPNEKMIRPVCMNCHSLEFSIDALADEALIDSNFTGQPSRHVESIDMSLDRLR